jgi:hypothetical protein
MPRIRVALLGDNTPENPLRAALPTYSTVWRDVDKRIAIVDVPDNVWPLLKHELPSAVVNHPDYGEVITAIDAQYRIAAAMRFDKKYREHVGEFSLDVV